MRKTKSCHSLPYWDILMINCNSHPMEKNDWLSITRWRKICRDLSTKTFIQHIGRFITWLESTSWKFVFSCPFHKLIYRKKKKKHRYCVNLTWSITAKKYFLIFIDNEINLALLVYNTVPLVHITHIVLWYFNLGQLEENNSYYLILSQNSWANLIYQ